MAVRQQPQSRLETFSRARDVFCNPILTGFAFHHPFPGGDEGLNFRVTNLVLFHLPPLFAGGEGAVANEQLLRPIDAVPCDRQEVQWGGCLFFLPSIFSSNFMIAGAVGVAMEDLLHVSQLPLPDARSESLEI